MNSHNRLATRLLSAMSVGRWEEGVRYQKGGMKRYGGNKEGREREGEGRSRREIPKGGMKRNGGNKEGREREGEGGKGKEWEGDTKRRDEEKWRK